MSVYPARSADPAYLIPLTPEARRVAHAPALSLLTFSFRVGRGRRDPNRGLAGPAGAVAVVATPGETASTCQSRARSIASVGSTS